MKRISIGSIFVVGFSYFIITTCITGCAFESEEALFPISDCDTIQTINYNEEIVSIVGDNCYSCHGNLTAPTLGNGVSFEGYTNINNYLNFSSYSFVASIKHLPGFQPMPKDVPKLSACEIRQLEIWINNDHPDN